MRWPMFIRLSPERLHSVARAVHVAEKGLVSMDQAMQPGPERACRASTFMSPQPSKMIPPPNNKIIMY